MNNYELAELDYKSGMKYKDIAEKYGVTVNTVKSWKQRYNWTRKSTEKKTNVCTQSEKGMHTKKSMHTNEKSKIDWLKLENEYVTDISGNPVTLKGLSEKYDISFQVIQNYSADNNWTEKRKNYIRNTLEKTQEKLSDQTADVIAQIVGNINSALLKATTELHTHEEVNGFGQLITQETETVRTGKLERLVRSLTALQKIEIEREKLEIEKQKLSKGNDSNNLPVFIIGEDKLED